MSSNTEKDAIRLDLDVLHEKVEKSDSRFAFPFDPETTKATLLLLIRRVRAAERVAERLQRQFDLLAEEYEELRATSVRADLPADGSE